MIKMFQQTVNFASTCSIYQYSCPCKGFSNPAACYSSLAPYSYTQIIHVHCTVNHSEQREVLSLEWVLQQHSTVQSTVHGCISLSDDCNFPTISSLYFGAVYSNQQHETYYSICRETVPMNYYGSSFIQKIIMKFHIPKTSKYSHETVPKKTRNFSQRKEQFYFCPEKQ